MSGRRTRRKVLVGLRDVDVIEPLAARIDIPLECPIGEPPECPDCRERAWVKDRPSVERADRSRPRHLP